MTNLEDAVAVTLDRLRRAARYQLNVARDWLRLADKPDLEPAFAFVAAFGALNAMYWLWTSVDAAEGGRRHGNNSDHPGELKLPRDEMEHVTLLVAKLGESTAEKLLADKRVDAALRYLRDRGPIRDMRFREGDEDGFQGKGVALNATLEDTTRSPVERLQALAGVLYLVRCNLVHGSKKVDGTGNDQDLLREVAPALRQLADAACAFTEDHSALRD